MMHATRHNFNCLTNFRRGTLSSSGNNGSGVLDQIQDRDKTRSQDWNLDALGNWNTLTTNGSAQNRTFNGENQITSIGGQYTPGYDNNGNTTRDDNGTIYYYDAWNRMAEASHTGGTSWHRAIGNRQSPSIDRPAQLRYFNAQEIPHVT